MPAGRPRQDPDKLLKSLYDWSVVHRRRPTSRELDSDPTLPAAQTLRTAFGTVREAYVKANVLGFAVRDRRGRNLTNSLNM